MSSKTVTSPFDVQVGGGHYKHMAIQPVEYIDKNKLDFISGCVIKYVSRAGRKHDALEDWKKAKHFCELKINLLEQEAE